MTAFASIVALISMSATVPSIPRLSAADVAPECTPSDDRDFLGSIHAGSSYQAPGLVEPIAKERQAFSCGGQRAVVLWMQLPHDRMSSLLAFFGARLWGEPGPSRMHTDELLWKGDVLAVVSSPGARGVVEALAGRLERMGYRRYRGAETSRPARSSPSIDLRIAKEIDCRPRSSDALRSWCPASRIVRATFKAPAKAETYLGLSVPVPDGSTFRDAAARDVAVSILALGGGRAFLGSLDPDGDSERKELAEIQGRITATLEGRKGGLRVPPQLASFLDSVREDLPARGAPVTDGRFTLRVPARIYFVEGSPVSAYVVVEEGSDGRRVNVFPAVAPTR